MNSPFSKSTASDWQLASHRLVEFYVKVMPRALGAKSCAVYVQEGDKDQFWCTGTHITEQAMALSEINDSAVLEAVRTAEVVQRVQSEGNSVICVPIFSTDGRHVVGAVELIGPAEYSGKDRALLDEMLQYLEASIENIRGKAGSPGLRWAGRIAIGLTLTCFALIVLFTVYWFTFYLTGI